MSASGNYSAAPNDGFRPGRRLSTPSMWSLAPPDRRPALSHPACELVHVEIVPPGADLAVTHLEGPHDLQLERLARELEDVHPLGHHDRPVGCDVDEAEVETLDAWRARADERHEVVRDG